MNQKGLPMDGLFVDTWSFDCNVNAIRDCMVRHPVFAEIRDINSLRIFMEAHVFAVWDFMSLVKRLQRDLTCVALPWLPPRDRRAAQLINQIVLGEETDISPSGEPISHLELYLAAMREVGANSKNFELFKSALASGAPLETAFDCAAAPAFVRDFTTYTLEVAREAPLPVVMASLFLGREEVVPAMFSSLLKGWCVDAARAPMFVYYLERHIKVDGGEHVPAARAILDDAIGGNPRWRVKVLTAAHESIQARIGFWDGLLGSLRNRRQAHSDDPSHPGGRFGKLEHPTAAIQQDEPRWVGP
jgi:hypothetical protein